MNWQANKCISLIASALIILTGVQRVEALPIVTEVIGDAVRDSSLSIKGSGFGQKETAVPLGWHNFETAQVGQSIHQASNNFWKVRLDQQQQWPIVKASPVRSNSNRSIELLLNPTSLSYANNLPFNGKAYLSYWLKWDWGERVGDSWQIKVFYFGVGKEDREFDFDGPSLPIYSWWYVYQDGRPSRIDHYLNVRKDKALTTTERFNLPQSFIPIGEQGWIQVSAAIDWGTPGSSDAKMDFWASHSDGSVISHQSFESVNLLLSGEQYPNYLRIGPWYLDQNASTGTFPVPYMDDIYIDNSFARVEIGDNRTYSLCTHREIQIPAAWSDTEIQISFNQGSFADGDIVYLFVVDQTGSVSSSGRAVVVGEGQVTPNPPENVRTQ